MKRAAAPAATPEVAEVGLAQERAARAMLAVGAALPTWPRRAPIAEEFNPVERQILGERVEREAREGHSSTSHQRRRLARNVYSEFALCKIPPLLACAGVGTTPKLAAPIAIATIATFFAMSPRRRSKTRA